MRQTKAERIRILNAVRYRPDTASGLADRLLIKEEKAMQHLRCLHASGKVRIVLIDYRNEATWVYAGQKRA